MLDVLRKIVLEVNRAPDLASALDLIVRHVKASMMVDAASVYLADDDHKRFLLMATDGLRPDVVGKVERKFGEGLVGLVGEREEPVNLEDAPSHPRYRFVADTGEEVYHGFLGVPIMQHRRLLGVLVVRVHESRRFSEGDLTFLVTLAAQLAGAITHAEASGGVSQMLQEVSGGTYALRGVAGASGVGIGQARVIYQRANLRAVPDRHCDDPEIQEVAFRRAVEAVHEDITGFAKRMSGTLPKEDLALFDAFVLMLESDSLIDRTVERIYAGNWAPGALRETIYEHIATFENMEDPYLAERATDIRDLGRRILQRLQLEAPDEQLVYPETILVGEEITASQLAEIPPENLAGVVSARGSRSSHVAILARALGVPAVMGVADMPVGRLEGQELIVDGYLGRVYVRPARAVRDEYVRLAREEDELAAGLRELVELPATTTDDVTVPLYVNTGLLSDISPALRSGAEGVGLYRTEIPFLIRDGFPSEDEQYQIYRQVLEAFAPAPVTLRTLDIGGDKPLEYFPIEEENPFLGWRGIRVTLDHPEIFLSQLRAMLRASSGLDNLQVLFPMVSGVPEVQMAVSLLHRAVQELLEEGISLSMPRVGIMIEVPSAVYQIEPLSRLVDFFSVGTNDLTQYLLAVDRNNSRVAELYDALHPAVLRALRHIVDDARECGKPVSVCGEMAGDPAAAILLLGMGVGSMSMAAYNLPRVKWVLRTMSASRARELLEQAHAMTDPAEIRVMLNEELESVGLGGLVRAGK